MRLLDILINYSWKNFIHSKIFIRTIIFYLSSEIVVEAKKKKEI